LISVVAPDDEICAEPATTEPPLGWAWAAVHITARDRTLAEASAQPRTRTLPLPSLVTTLPKPQPLNRYLKRLGPCLNRCPEIRLHVSGTTRNTRYAIEGWLYHHGTIFFMMHAIMILPVETLLAPAALKAAPLHVTSGYCPSLSVDEQL
jgi:hypothetical protein